MSIWMPIIYWIAAICWTVNLVLRVIYGQFSFASMRSVLDTLCCLVWIMAAVMATSRYIKQKKQLCKPKASPFGEAFAMFRQSGRRKDRPADGGGCPQRKRACTRR